MFTQNDINTLLQIIPNGRQNAITAKVIEQKLGYSVVGNQVKTRRLIAYAIDNGIIILSSSSRAPKGYWISTDRQETLNYINSLRSRAKIITDRKNYLRNRWNNNNPNNRIP